MGKQYNKYYNKNDYSSRHYDNVNEKEQDVDVKEDEQIIMKNESNDIEQDNIEKNEPVIVKNKTDKVETKKCIDVVYQRDVKYVVTVDALNVREHPSFDSNVKRILRKGIMVSVDYYDNQDALMQSSEGYNFQNEKWIKIFRPCCGYVRSNFIARYLNKSSIQL